MAKEAAQDRADQLGPGAAETLRLTQDELIGVLRRQVFESDVSRREAVGEKGSDGGQVVREGGRLDAALVQ